VGARVREKRRKQAEFLANYIQGRQTANPNEKIITVGDMERFPCKRRIRGFVRHDSGNPGVK